jgi:hypothetical protein
VTDGDDPYWSGEKIERLSARFGVHDRGYHFHFPRESFLRYGYRPPGGYVKDFSILEHEGRWHVFHIDGRPGEICWITGNEISFGHCSTDDFQHWMRHRMALAVGDGAWDDEHVWAPFVRCHGDSFMMFYMGQGTGGTRIARAVSPDLARWRKLGPIEAAHGRDPFVFEHEGRFVLAYTSHDEVDGHDALCACESRDLERWVPLAPLMLTRHGGPESASIHRMDDGRWVAWVNDWGDSSADHPRIYRACYAFSDDPLKFDGESLTTFRFVKNEDEVPLDPEWNEPNGMYTQAPGAIELVERGGRGIWLVAYYRIVGNGFRLFFGALDWNTSPATITEIGDNARLAGVLSAVR